jgi:EmrB/QacA subfamily drug resistance transporter
MLEKVLKMDAVQSGARRWWALGALAISMLVIGIDLFVLSLALPTLSVDLHASTSDLQWFVDAYSLALAAALLPAGLLGDRWGRRKMLAGALGLFGVASLICAYASSSGELIAARAVLGVAAAVIMPMGLAVLPVLFTPAERPKAIGIVAGATFVGFPVGPILGGWLLDHFWWGSVFLINVPVVVLAVIAVLFLMPESRSSHRPRIDAGGVLISGAGLITLVYGVISAGQKGWSDSTAIATMIAGAVVLAGFGLWERMIRRRPGGEPLVDLSLFRSAGFAAGTTLSTLVQFALFGITFAMPQFFLDVWGLDSLASGVRLLPLVGGLAVGLGIGQRLQSPRAASGNRPARGPLVSVKVLATIGFVIMAAALAVGTATGEHSSTGFVSAWFATTGLGLGLAMPTAMNAALGALSAERSGSGSALMTTMRQVGGTIGVAVLGTVLNSVYQARLHLGGLPHAVAGAARDSVTGGLAAAHATQSAALLTEVRGAYSGGLDVMLWVCAAIAVLAAVVAAVYLPRLADPQPAEPRPAALSNASAAAQAE